MLHREMTPLYRLSASIPMLVFLACAGLFCSWTFWWLSTNVSNVSADNSPSWAFVFSPFLVIGPLMLSVASHRITLFPDRLIYKTLFTKQEVFYSQIRNITLLPGGPRGSPVLQLMLLNNKNPLQMALASFDSNACSIIVNVLAQHAPNVSIDNKAKQEAGLT